MNRYLYIVFIEFGIIFVAMHLIIYRERSGHHLSGIKDFFLCQRVSFCYYLRNVLIH